ncbi:hypothetical protein [Coleofasciculus sp. E2-BRE-01]|uniref:hypothetical protein n=1 Tax=Coleofasciculus sp. E2-BRE-01 TaxID=3069524 RepID=UPI003300203D
MAVTVHPKETDLNCNFMKGWVAVGQYYTIIGTRQIGTDDFKNIWGWVDTRSSLLDLSRQSSWSYIGIKNGRPTFRNAVTGRTYSINVLSVYSPYKYQFTNTLFCKCGIGEVKCTDCCVVCCSVASEFLEKLKG